MPKEGGSCCFSSSKNDTVLVYPQRGVAKGWDVGGGGEDVKGRGVGAFHEQAQIRVVR